MRMNVQNIRELVNRGERYLVDNGVPNARRNAEWMLSGVLGCRSAELYLDADIVPAPADIATYVGHLERRGAREPLQHILGSTEFMSLHFLMSPGVYIPRPDTEVLVETVEARLGRGRRQRKVLDLCCGSGVIGISLVKRLPRVTGVAVDISHGAVTLATRNAHLNEIGDRLQCVRAEALEYLKAGTTRFDAIISNPPYVSTGDIPGLAPEIRSFDPTLSLDGGADGLDFYRAVIPRLEDSLKAGGLVAFEMASTQGVDISQLLRQAKFENIAVVKDYAGLDRVVVGELTT